MNESSIISVTAMLSRDEIMFPNAIMIYRTTLFFMSGGSFITNSLCISYESPS